MGDKASCPTCTGRERKEALSIFRQLWLDPDSPLHRMYSSWEELERNIEVKSESGLEVKRRRIQRCPYCGSSLEVDKPLDGIFPYFDCRACGRALHVEDDLSLRKLSVGEEAEVPHAWIRIVDDLARKKVAVVLKLE